MDFDSFEMNIWRNQLKNIIKKNSFEYSPEPKFKLNCGAISNFYFDCKKTTLLPDAQVIIGTLVFNMLYKYRVQGIGGLTLGADPIALSVGYASKLSGYPINPFIVRKSTKDHGTRNRIEGLIYEGMEVAVVDDVITTGASTIEAINACKDAGLIVKLVIAMIDREEMNGANNIIELVPELISIYKASDFIS